MTYTRLLVTVSPVAPRELVIGVDAGGTTTRAILADTSGRVLGRGVADGINQRSSGGATVERLSAAVGDALAGSSPSDVGAAVLGVAGAGAAGHARTTADAVAAWQGLGIPTPPVVVTDLLGAYAAGEPGPSGSVLVAGTGAGAAAVVDRAVVRQADGAGWLLGDVGSAVWLAREALVAAVADLDGRGAATGLTAPLLERLLDRPGAGVTVQDVIAAAYDRPVAGLGALAPVVTTQTERGDAVAAAIVARGVLGLLASLDAVGTGGPVVLAGALLASTGPVRDGVLTGLRDRGVATPGIAHQPAAGAAWLALVELGVTDPAVHAELAS
jgi:glucosamine kinase